MTLSIGYAMTIEHASAENLQELADHNMYPVSYTHLSSKKTPLPAISHKKDSLTKSDKIMRFPSHILTRCV